MLAGIWSRVQIALLIAALMSSCHYSVDHKWATHGQLPWEPRRGPEVTVWMAALPLHRPEGQHLLIS